MSVSVSGTTVVVGAPDSRWGSTWGAVYVFTVPDSGPTSVSEAVVLTSPRSIRRDTFGESVSISGDTIVVGAPGERIDEQWRRSRLGATYVFTKPPTGWASTSDAAKLTPEVGEAGDWFGWSVVVSGDTVVVGGQNYNSRRATNNAAYVFTKPTGGWVSASATPLSVPYVPHAYSYDSDRLGVSVGVAGDTVVVGAPIEAGLGMVCVFEDYLDG